MSKDIRKRKKEKQGEQQKIKPGTFVRFEKILQQTHKKKVFNNEYELNFRFKALHTKFVAECAHCDA